MTNVQVRSAQAVLRVPPGDGQVSGEEDLRPADQQAGHGGPRGRRAQPGRPPVHQGGQQPAVRLRVRHRGAGLQRAQGQVHRRRHAEAAGQAESLPL